jgi:murein L,D-transpeptidase YcbB/YkuD
VSASSVTSAQLASGNYRVAQRSGAGNSLGRIIFRFDNNFSIFVHDTSSRGVFNRQTRSVSHGCIRVEKPYELACYMLRDKDPEMAEKIQYSMEVDMSNPKRDRRKLVSYKKVEPQVPIFIVYYTLFPVPEGEIKSFPDVYEYDSIIAKALRSI